MIDYGNSMALAMSMYTKYFSVEQQFRRNLFLKECGTLCYEKIPV